MKVEVVEDVGNGSLAERNKGRGGVRPLGWAVGCGGSFPRSCIPRALPVHCRCTVIEKTYKRRNYSTIFTASRVAWVAKEWDNTVELAFGGFLC